MIIGVVRTFDAAHRLLGYSGKCNRLHGHTYKLIVEIAGEVGRDGMVMDFATLKGSVDKVVSDLDHSYLNDVLSSEPTCEETVAYIVRKLSNLPLHRVVLYETPTAYALWERT